MHLFFDLDHTLWDFDRNSSDCLTEIIEEWQPFLPNGFDGVEFISTFKTINYKLWEALDLGQITHEYLRVKRFAMAFEALKINVSEQNSLSMNDSFLAKLPTKKHLIPFAVDVLVNLSQKHQLHIISNGYMDIQVQKMKNSNILDFFEEIITQDIADSRKPDKKIFEFALNKSKANTAESIMIGDTLLADISGAKNAGLRAIHYDAKHSENNHSQINDLRHLLEII